MMGQAKSAVAENRKLAIFPEGTRVTVGDRPELKSGFAGLYKLLNLPVVPVAVSAGHIFPPRKFIKFPGVITYRIMPTIPPKLPREEIETRVGEAINALNRLDDTAGG
jgi:1-acyl-sn-glycerol-3-phosphate acyltransferase